MLNRRKNFTHVWNNLRVSKYLAIMLEAKIQSGDHYCKIPYITIVAENLVTIIVTVVIMETFVNLSYIQINSMHLHNIINN